MAEDSVRCICGFSDDDGYTIQCESCLVWQHVVCVNLTKSTVPDHYFCEKCNPRVLDAQRARQIQSTRLKALKKEKEEKKAARRTIQSEVGKKRKESLQDKSRQKVAKPGKEPKRDINNIVSPPKRKSGAASTASLNDNSHSNNHTNNNNNPTNNNSNNGHGAADSGISMIYAKAYGDFFDMDPYLSKQKKTISAGNSPEIRKRKVKLEPVPRPDHIFEDEYAKGYFRAQQAAFNRLFDDKDVETFISSRLLFWHTQDYSLYTVVNQTLKMDENVNNLQTMGEFLLSNHNPLVLHSSVFDCILGQTVVEVISKSSDTHITDYGLFATTDIPPNSIITDIKGTWTIFDHLPHTDIPFKTYDIHDQEQIHSSTTTPPFVYPAQVYSGVDKDEPLHLVMDSQRYGAWDGRFCRFFCCSDKDQDTLDKEEETGFEITPNALLKLAYIKHTNDKEELEYLTKPKERLFLTDRLRLVLVSTITIQPGQEIILKFQPGFLHYPCVCMDTRNEHCHVKKMIDSFNDLELAEVHKNILLPLEWSVEKHRKRKEEEAKVAKQKLISLSDSIVPQKREISRDASPEKSDKIIQALLDPRDVISHPKRIKLETGGFSHIITLNSALSQGDNDTFTPASTPIYENVSGPGFPDLSITENPVMPPPPAAPKRVLSLKDFMKKRALSESQDSLDSVGSEFKINSSISEDYQTPASVTENDGQISLEPTLEEVVKD